MVVNFNIFIWVFIFCFDILYRVILRLFNEVLFIRLIINFFFFFVFKYSFLICWCINKLFKISLLDVNKWVDDLE